MSTGETVEAPWTCPMRQGGSRCLPCPDTGRCLNCVALWLLKGLEPHPHCPHHPVISHHRSADCDTEVPHTCMHVNTHASSCTHTNSRTCTQAWGSGGGCLCEPDSASQLALGFLPEHTLPSGSLQPLHVLMSTFVLWPLLSPQKKGAPPSPPHPGSRPSRPLLLGLCTLSAPSSQP